MSCVPSLLLSDGETHRQSVQDLDGLAAPVIECRSVGSWRRSAGSAKSFCPRPDGIHCQQTDEIAGRLAIRAAALLICAATVPRPAVAVPRISKRPIVTQVDLDVEITRAWLPQFLITLLGLTC